MCCSPGTRASNLLALALALLPRSSTAPPSAIRHPPSAIRHRALRWLTRSCFPVVALAQLQGPQRAGGEGPVCDHGGLPQDMEDRREQPDLPRVFTQQCELLSKPQC